MLAALPAEGVQYSWTQLSGTEVRVANPSAPALRIEVPETFAREELVFQVEVMINGETLVQEITVEVKPVDAATRAPVGQQPRFERLQQLDDADSFVEQRGVGKVWASLVAFSSSLPVRPGRR